jgi:autotransporter-associated beta strand protein
MQQFMTRRFLWVTATTLALAAGVFLIRFDSHAPSRKTTLQASVAGPSASAAVAGKSPGTPGPLPSPKAALARESDPGVNPYAGALREPGKSKRSWDPEFIKQFQNAASNAPIRFELTEGVMASGVIKITQHRDSELVYLSGELSAPEPGKFFFLTPPAPGKAGKAVGVIEFPGSRTAYRIEPTGPNGEPELWQRRQDEVICLNLPLTEPSTGTNETANVPPLRPDTTPSYIPSYNSNIVSLQSYPGSPAVLLLDFFGGYTPTWGGVSYPRPDVSNAQIKDLWKRVAEDYMPCNINVTTDIRVYQNAPAASRQKCVFTPSTSAMPANAAGVAYIGSWNWGSDTVCWSIYTSGKNGGEVGAHEPGHTLGLGHQGTSTQGYYGGQGSGATGWGPIMGVGYYQNVSSWAKGEYQDANNHEDELNLITTQNNSVTYRPDDTGNTLATSRYLEIYPNYSAWAEGVIERTADTDAFQFTTAGGRVSLTANAVGDWADLAVMATLANANNVVIASNNPQSVLSATITTNLSSGTYTFRVTGAGRNSPLTNGFSAYASLGYYWVTGYVAAARLPTRLSVAEHAPNGTVVGVVPADNIYSQPLAYAILSGNTGSTFSIDASGTARVANNTLLDYYRLATNTMLPVQFDMLVNITNLANPALTELNRRVVVAVLNFNEAPIVTGFTNSVLEHAQSGLVLGTVSASDRDFAQVLSYRILSGNSNNVFAIDQAGAVTVVGDLNAAVQSAYTLAVAVSEVSALNPLISTGYVTINVVSNRTPFHPGSISYAVYDGIGTGNLVSDLTNNARFPSDPSFEKPMPSFEGDNNRADGYGAVMRGYLIPPVSGSYTFWVATDDNGELWMSATTNPAAMTRIVYLSGSGSYASPRQWTKYPSQQSAARSLVAGQGYYIEARMKEGSGNDNFAVAWKGPATANLTNVISGQYLAPYFMNYVPHATGFAAAARRDAIAGARLGRITVTDANLNDSDTFSILSGNTDGIFSIDYNGWIRVADEAALQSTTTPSYFLGIQVTDSGLPPFSVTTTATLNITETNTIVPTGLQREMFYNLGGGTAVSDLTNNARYPGRPDALVALSSLASPVDVADNYGSRIRAYLTPTTSGSYTFFISSDDNSLLRFSATGNPATATAIASVPNYTTVNTWTSYSQQKSALISLVAGQRYYLEALQKEGGGGDHVEVGWAGPGIPGTNVIDGTFLSPLDINYAPQFTNQTLQVFNTVANNTLIGNVSAADSPLDTLTFKIVAGNDDNTFTIAPDTGGITVVDNTLITNGTVTSFLLTVLVQDSGCGGLYPLHTAQATVTINVVSGNGAALVWTGAAGTNAWSSSNNWAGAVPGAGSRVTFGYASQQTNANDLVSTLNSVRFNSGGFRISGNPLTLQSGLTNSVGTNVWAIDTTLGAAQTWLNARGTLMISGAVNNAGGTLTLNANDDIQVRGAISGTGALLKNGTGRLLMQGVHTYSGITSVLTNGSSTAALQLAGQGDLDIRNSDLSLNARMDLGNHNATVGALTGAGQIYANDLPQPVLTIGANNHSGTFSGLIQDSTVGLGVTLGLVKLGVGTQTFTANSTFTGGFMVNGGTVVLSGVNGSSPAGRGLLTINSGATVNTTSDNQLGLETSGYLAALNLTGGVFNAWNNVHLNSLTLCGGTVGVASGAAQVSGLDMRAFNNANPLVTTLANDSAATINSRMTLNAPVAFDVADGAAVTDLLIGGVIGGASSLTKTGPGLLALAANNTYTGGTLVNAGVLQIGAGGSSGSVSGNITNNASLVYNCAGTITQNGIISGPGSLTKTGSGKVTLLAANTCTGPITISQGTLALSGSGSIYSSASVAVQAGAMLDASALSTGLTVPASQTLSGNGSVVGNAQVNGLLAPSPSIGGLTFAGSLALAGVTLLEINKSGSTLTNDWAASTGTLTYGGALVVTNTGSPLTLGDSFPLFSAATFGGAFSTMTLPPLAAGLAWSASQLPLSGTLSVVLSSPPQLVPVGLSGTNLLVSLQTELGSNYILQSATNLDTPMAWVPVSTNSGTGAVLTISAPFDSTQPQSYFRVVVY